MFFDDLYIKLVKMGLNGASTALQRHSRRVKMNDIERMLQNFRYIMSPNEIMKDIDEFSDVLMKTLNLFSTEEQIKKMNVNDVLDFVYYSKKMPMTLNH